MLWGLRYIEVYEYSGCVVPEYRAGGVSLCRELKYLRERGRSTCERGVGVPYGKRGGASWGRNADNGLRARI